MSELLKRIAKTLSRRRTIDPDDNPERHCSCGGTQHMVSHDLDGADWECGDCGKTDRTERDAEPTRDDD